MALEDDISNLPTTVGEGITGHLNNHQVLHATAKAHESRLDTMDSRASITWSYEGTDNPSLSSYPGIKTGDYIVRKSDGQEWRLDSGTLTMVSKPPGDPITPEDTTFFYVSSNMINLDGLLENQILPTGQGTPEENAVTNVTVPIRVNSGDTYTITAYLRITYYDSAGEYVRDFSSTPTQPDTRVIPDNVAYARVSVLTTRLDRVQMNLGTELLPYEPGNTPYIPASYLDASGMQNRLNLDVGTRIFSGDIMIYGDTGLRNITDMIPAQIYGSTLSVQRYANMVYLNLNSISLTTGTTASFILPNGFRPSTNGTLRKETANGYVDLSNNGQITINPNTAAYNTAQIIYVTRDSWPTTLPGIPA